MLNIRPATPADVPTMLRFIHELATYEREPDAVIATETDLLRDGFSLAPDGIPLNSPIRFRALIADYSELLFRSAPWDRALLNLRTNIEPPAIPDASRRI